MPVAAEQVKVADRRFVATALNDDLAIVTRNMKDFAGLDVAVSAASIGARAYTVEMRKLCLLFLLCLSLVSALITYGFGQPAVHESDRNDARSLRGKIRSAQAQNRRVVDLGEGEGVPPIVESLQQAARAYSVVLATPMSKETVIEADRQLRTWYRMRILERISTAPASVLSLSLSDVIKPERPTKQIHSSDEVFLLQHGGTMIVDGVTVIQRMTDFPPLDPGTQYLCFIDIGTDGRIALAHLSMFQVKGRDELKPLSQAGYPLASEIRAQHHNSLLAVRRAITVSRGAH